MKKVEIRIIFIMLGIILFSKNSFSGSSIDVRTEYESWKTGINGTNSAVLFGLGGSYDINSDWVVGGGMVFGSFDADGNQDTLKRLDIDLAVGYQFFPQFVVFAGYRLTNIDYTNAIDTNRSFTDLSHGLGIGLGVYQPIYTRTIIYARLSISGLYSTLDSNITGEDRGGGISTGVEAGITYEFYQQTTAGLTLKQQSSTIDYRGDTEKWSHSYLRVGFTLSHYF